MLKLCEVMLKLSDGFSKNEDLEKPNESRGVTFDFQSNILIHSYSSSNANFTSISTSRFKKAPPPLLRTFSIQAHS